jgi:tetratricopeptide (TPR) repeat protein
MQGGNMKTLTMSVAAVLILAGVLVAQQRFDGLRPKDFQSGLSGNSEEFETLMRTIEEALASNPKNAKAKVTHGIGLFRRSGDAAQKGDHETAEKLYQAAINEMDQAVQLAPDDAAVRVPRGSILITASRFMPPQMSRPLLESGLSDYERVLKVQEQDETFSKRSPHQRGELLTGLGDGWARMGNNDKARSYFERIVAELGGTIYERRAHAWLENKPEAKSPTFFACSGCHVE